MILDANVFLRAFFPDEDQIVAQSLIKDHVLGRIHICAPTLLEYEITNAIVQAIRRERITDTTGTEILDSFEGLEVEMVPVKNNEVLRLARQFDRSAYNASYLALAQERQDTFVTGDRRLYNAVAGQLSWVKWIGDIG